jgi:hypothetical protein
MKSVFTRTPVLGILVSSLVIALALKQLSAAENDQAILQADHSFLQAIAKADKAALEKFLDADFTWTNSDGKTDSRAEVLQTLPVPALGDESGADVKQLTYAEAGAVIASRGKMHILRIWVKRPAGWRLLVYHEVKLSDQPPTAGGSGVTECVNPCKSVPFEPKNDAERAIIASWRALETGVTSHDAVAWAPHIADEFVMLNSNNDHPFTKADRIAILNKQKQSGIGSAPSPLVSAQMFDFSDAVVMTCMHQPHTGKPVHVSRLWIKRNGQWIMAISFQTTIQAAPAKAS